MVRRPPSVLRVGALVSALAFVLAACASTSDERYPRGAIEPLVDAVSEPEPAPVDPGSGSADSGRDGTTAAAPTSEQTGSGAEPQTGAGGEDPRPGAPAGPEPVGGAEEPRPRGSEVAGPAAPSGQTTEVAMGPGVTADTIKIGFQYAEDLQSGFAAVGASGDAPDERKINQALVDWINANGGVRGRQIQAVHHATQATSGTWASQAQAACSTFTEDNQVYAVVSSAVGGDDSLLACLAEKQTPLVELNLWLFDQPYFEQHRGILYRPGKMRADAWAREYVEGLHRIGYFDGATVGLLRFDAPVFDRLSDGVVNPTVDRLGLTLEDEVEISTPKSVADFGAMAGEFNNAIVRFRSQGIDHVMMLENAGIMPFFFLQQAESQGYRPVYGFTSTDIPQTLQGQNSPSQLSRSVGVGWTPPNDVGHGDHPGGNPNYALCRQVMEEQGVTTTSGFYIQSHCDGAFFLRAAIERAPELTTAGLLAGVESLGSDYLSPFTMGSSYGPGKYDGADVVRPFAFQDDCECFRYVGEPRLRSDLP